MTELAEGLGSGLMIVGGWLILTAILGFLSWLACEAWAGFSNRFRDVCRAESLIHEYRLHKLEFMEWKANRERAYEDG